MRLKLLAAIGVLMLSAACAQPKYALHTAYRLSDCGKVISREKMAVALVKRGYLRSSEIRGPYQIFHKPAIEEKGPFAAEAYEDKAGDIAVAVCPGASEQFVLVEEWRGCKDRKDCTDAHQREVRKLVEEWGCKVNERSAHSESWKLEERQDWTNDSCSFIATNLPI